MITEDYCSFEVAKLLKKKGFNEVCEYFYDEYKDEDKHVVCSNGCSAYNDDKHPTYYSMPTHQMAMKWLREEKNILIYVYPVIDLPVKNNYTFYWKWDGKKKRHDAPHIGDKHNYESFEQAVEAALKYSLENLI